jgi:hypothetical protein
MRSNPLDVQAFASSNNLRSRTEVSFFNSRRFFIATCTDFSCQCRLTILKGAANGSSDGGSGATATGSTAETYKTCNRSPFIAASDGVSGAAFTNSRSSVGGGISAAATGRGGANASLNVANATRTLRKVRPSQMLRIKALPQASFRPRGRTISLTLRLENGPSAAPRLSRQLKQVEKFEPRELPFQRNNCP